MSVPKQNNNNIIRQITFIKFCLYVDYNVSKINIVCEPTKSRLNFINLQRILKNNKNNCFFFVVGRHILVTISP